MLNTKVEIPTTATNRKLRELLTGIRNETLIPSPDFQRRLVWTNKDKVNFLRTVLDGYPFPEIFIAAGSINTDTGEGNELLVDGQQRITTLYQYFTASPELALPADIPVYDDLDDDTKLDFLEYGVVVRYLGNLSLDEIKAIFTRINSIKYSLNAMEINNARYDGAFKKFAQSLAEHDFFDRHRVFNTADIRRMEDIRYTLTVVSTLLSTYFYRDNELESFLQMYNDEFPEGQEIRENIETVFAFIEQCELPASSRTWHKADLFTLIVELYRSIIQDGQKPDEKVFAEHLERFYYEVDHREKLVDSEFVFPQSDIENYAASIFQGTNNRSQRITRGEIISQIIKKSLQASAGNPISHLR